MASEAYRALLARAQGELPAPAWGDAADLTRLSIESFVADKEGDARSLTSTGTLRLHGPGVVGHRADLDAVGGISRAWQRTVTAVGAALEGIRTARGKLPNHVANRTRLELAASPGAGSLVLRIQPAVSPLEEVEPDGDRALLDPPRPLADRASAMLIGLSDELARASAADLERLGDQFTELGPRVASSLRTLADVLVMAGVSLDAAWREPGAPTRRSSWTPEAARWVREFIDGQELDSEDLPVTGIAETISNRERWLLSTGEGDIRVTASALPPEDVRKVRAGDVVTLRVRATTRVQPDGTTSTTRKALELLAVAPPHDE